MAFGLPSDQRGQVMALLAVAAIAGAYVVWTYVVAINTATEPRVIADRLELATIGFAGSPSVYDWRRGAVEQTGALRAELAPRDWALWVCAPPCERADAGDVTKYVTIPSDQR